MSSNIYKADIFLRTAFKLSHILFQGQNCPSIETPLNGSLTLNVDNPGPGRRVTYTCERGFKISGNHGYDKRTCLSNGEWTGTSITCGLIKGIKYIIM